jgi:RNA-splicing ligase RtcB
VLPVGTKAVAEPGRADQRVGDVERPSARGGAEEALGAYKDVTAVVDPAEIAGLARKMARTGPLACVKG